MRSLNQPAWLKQLNSCSFKKMSVLHTSEKLEMSKMRVRLVTLYKLFLYFVPFVNRLNGL